MQITGIILTGGKSTRMGTDKALLKIGDETLLERAVNLCKPVCSQILISSDSPAHDFYGLKRVADEFPGCGPMSGIYSCLKQAETEWCFVISVDSAFITVDFVKFLISQTGNNLAVIPSHSGSIEPLVAMYNKKCLLHIENQIHSADYKMRNLFKTVKTKFAEVHEWTEKYPDIFKNLNRPEDFIF